MEQLDPEEIKREVNQYKAKWKAQEGTDKEEFVPLELPLDDEGYVQSFKLDQVEEYIEFFKKYGFVVVDNVVSSEDADATVSDVWDQLEKESKGAVKRDDTTTWYDIMGRQLVSRTGLVGNHVTSSAIAWKNRENPNLYEVFSNCIGEKELHVSVDRTGLMLPTKNVSFTVTDEDTGEKTTTVVDMDQWRTQSKWIHWDLNPWYFAGLIDDVKASTDEEKREHWTHPYMVEGALICEHNDSPPLEGVEKVQGLVAMCDSREEDGGFLTIPGFANYMEHWARQNEPIGRGHFVHLPRGSDLEQHARKISMRKGSLVVWSSRNAHCNYPNESSNFRVCQYIKMFPARMNKFPEERKAAVAKFLPEGYEPTPLGRKVFAQEDW